MSEPQSGPQVDMKEVMTMIAGKLQQGVEPNAILTDVTAMGIPEDRAKSLIVMVHKRMSGQTQPGMAQPMAPEMAGSLGLGILGGGAAAIIAGLIWGGLVILTGYEIGFVAWGVGIVAGMGVLILSRGGKGVPYQMVAVVASIGGIVFGKYFAFAHILKQAFAEKMGAEAAAQISMFSLGTVSLFFNKIELSFGGMDILFVGLALVTSWRMLGDKPVAAK